MTTLVAVIGAGSLGTAVATEARRWGHRLEIVTGLPWSHPDEAARAAWSQLSGAIDARLPHRLLIGWCAGGGTVAADRDAMERETALVATFVARTVTGIAQRQLPTVLAFASSGGAIWSGSDARVLTERTAPAPSHPYGRAKLAQEHLIREAVAGSPWLRARLARISNLYGPLRPGRAPHGLIEHLIVRTLERTPTSIYVPLDTMRDYVFTTQAARLMLHDGTRGFDLPPGSTGIDLLASGASHTIADVARTLERVLTRRVPLTVGMSWLASRQPRTLTFRSDHRDLQAHNAFPLPAGLRAVIDSRFAAVTR